MYALFITRRRRMNISVLDSFVNKIIICKK